MTNFLFYIQILIYFNIVFWTLSCRLLKIRCDKSKYQEASLSSKSVFQNVLDEINQFAPKDIGTSMTFFAEIAVFILLFWSPDSFIQRKTRSTAVTQSKDGTECRSSKWITFACAFLYFGILWNRRFCSSERITLKSHQQRKFSL